MSLNLTFIAVSLLGAGLDWTAYSPLDVPLDIEARQSKGEAVARVYAARGEYEGFRLEVSGGKKPVASMEIIAEAPGKDIPAPLIFALSPVTGDAITEPCLDVLEPAQPRALAEDEVANYWIRYAIPVVAKPGVRTTELLLRMEGERDKRVPVRLEIFDFQLPARSTLPSVFYLDRGALGLRVDDLAAWEPIYAALGGYRLGLSVWDGSDFSLRKSAATLEEHLDAAAALSGAPIIDLGGGNGRGWGGFPTREPGQTLDPLGIELNRLAGVSGLAEVGVTAAFDYFPERAKWGEAIELLGRVVPLGRIRRVALAPLHPAFEASLDAWALPYRACGPVLLQRLRSGAGIDGPSGLPPGHFLASSAGDNPLGTPYESRPEDAADGSLFTAWCPVAPKNAKDELWWEASFDEAVLTDELTCYWLPGHAAKKVELFTSNDGRNFATAKVDWEHKPAGSPIELDRAIGKLRFPSRDRAIRLVLSVSDGDPVPALAEVMVASVPLEAAPAGAHRIVPWLAVELDTFPSTVPGRPLVEPRMIGWTCWFGGLDGVLGASLNGWAKGSDSRVVPRGGGDFLFYDSGKSGLLPSMRLERLRDGLEDFEYLRLLGEARRDGLKLPQDSEDLLLPRPIPPNPTAEALADWAKHILETRLRIGRALDAAR